MGGSEESIAKGKSRLEHSLGLGQTPSAIPLGEVDISGEPRVVEIGWHPVAGLAGKWFAEETGLGRMITEGISKFPDPTQHWAVLVGDYCHQLWMVSNFALRFYSFELGAGLFLLSLSFTPLSLLLRQGSLLTVIQG